MRLLQPLKIVLLGSTLPAQGYTVAEGYERAARVCSTAAQNVSCPTDPEDHVALASSSSITPSNSPAEPSVAATSALAAAALSEEIRGFEDSLEILRPQFEKLRKIAGDKGGIIPEDPIFGTYHDAGVASHDIEMTLIRYLRVSRAGLKRKEQGDAKKIAQGALDRIKATLEYRREYDVLAMHAPGMARKLMVSLLMFNNFFSTFAYIAMTGYILSDDTHYIPLNVHLSISRSFMIPIREHACT